jgi:hypothetical protein
VKKYLFSRLVLSFVFFPEVKRYCENIGVEPQVVVLVQQHH